VAKLITLAVACMLASLAANCVQTAQQPASPSGPRSAAPAHASSIEGDWGGVLQVGETELHLVLHLSRNAQGEWHARLDSLNQAVYGMEASKVEHEADSLRFEISSVGAKFQGKIQPDRRTIRGLWEQSGTGLPLKFEKRTARTSAAATAMSKAEGTWQGAIEVSNMRMRLQLHIAHDEKGQLIASVDSLDQGVQGIPASQVTEKNSQLQFEMPAFQALYHGALNVAKNEIAGEWLQNDNAEKLVFHRSDKPLELRRPQNPSKPYPYTEEEVSVSAVGGATLAGTLTLPRGAGPFPAIVLVGGSGPADRDETVAGHKPFLVLADYLTRKGFAVLRYDKRGIAQSTGSYDNATMQQLAGDVQSVADYLKSRKEVDPKRLGILGHSEGGLLAALVTKNSADVKWLILLATPASNGERTLLRQSELIARTGGLPEDQIVRSQQFDRMAYAVVRQEKSPAAVETKLSELVKKSGLDASMPPAALQAQFRLMTAPWFRDFLDFEPQPILEQLQCPVLAINGDRDLQVDADDSVPLLRQAYEKSGNKDFTVIEIEGVNHLFQKAQSGSPSLYGAIDETIAPEVLNAIGDWLAKHTAL